MGISLSIVCETLEYTLMSLKGLLYHSFNRLIHYTKATKEPSINDVRCSGEGGGRTTRYSTNYLDLSKGLKVEGAR